MIKTILFSLIIVFLTILFFLEELLYPLRWFRRSSDRRKEWSGTVEEKKTRIVGRDCYLIVFQTDDGKRKKLRLDRKEDFDLYEQGRRYTKKAGDDLPDAGPKP